jgi:hypothetical protein
MPFTKVCVICKDDFTTSRVNAKWCPACKPKAARLYARMKAKEYRNAHKEEVDGRAREWLKAHPERVKEYRAKCYVKPCSSCGAKRWRTKRGRSGATRMDPFLCGECKMELRHMNKMVKCYYCGSMFFSRYNPGTETKGRACSSCYGVYTRAAEVLHISRERVRQLVNKKISRNGTTRIEAVDAILEERLGIGYEEEVR